MTKGGVGRAFHVGSSSGLREALAVLLGRPVLAGPAPELRAGDVVVVESSAPAQDLPCGNAFTACRAWKEQRGVAVYLALSPDDRFGPGLARFCLADGHVVWDPARGLVATADLGPARARAPRRSVDQLLERVERSMAGDGERAVSALQRLLHWERQDTLLHRLQDPETGLFDGPYASLKLDEEFKRAQRMHLPLALILLDMGLAAAELPVAGPARRELLAEVASVFLNECRDIDVLARFTETTFLFLLPGTGADGAAVLARRMLDALAERSFAGTVRLQPSAGLAVVPASGVADRRTFVAVAEACLERARSGAGDGGLCTSWE